MVRSMYSGVSGMKAHQARMDVIGNNIANVNTYGFKSSRATFRDIYYQTLSGASEATTTRGGTNPSQIGYGSKIGSVDVLQTRSSFQMTDNGMDVAIAGEGFFQVQDTNGNTYYTRAGMLNIDSAGNLVDMNGNFVLGVSGNPMGKAPGSDRIQVSVPAVSPKPASVEETINNVNISISASNNNEAGNVAINIISDSSLPLGQDVMVKPEELTTNGITVRLNSNGNFSLATLNSKINDQITQANGGKQHPGGTFTISMDPDPFAAAGGTLTGAQISSKDFSDIPGKITGMNKSDFHGFSFDSTCSTSSGFTSDNTGITAMTYDYTAPLAGAPGKFDVKMTVGGTEYTGTIPENAATSGQIQLKSAAGETVTINHPGYSSLETKVANKTANETITIAPLATTTSAAAEKSKSVGISSKPFKLKGGTDGGVQTVADLSSIAIGSDGIIEAIHPELGRMQLGRIDLVTFENPQGLQQSGNTYFTETSNSGKAQHNQPGISGAGALAAGSLEMSNVDLSREFSDMITTQRGFQANSRLITVSDEILNELVNLKR